MNSYEQTYYEYFNKLIPNAENWAITLIVNEMTNKDKEISRLAHENAELRERMSPTQLWAYENEKH